MAFTKLERTRSDMHVSAHVYYQVAPFSSNSETKSDHKAIFSSPDRDMNRRLADLFQDLGCSYHLVQSDPSSRPRIPALTPEGFSRWMTLHLQAFPDEVYCRLEKIVADFPLDTASLLDGKSERLPKQLSRYLLPETPNLLMQSLLKQAIKRHFSEAALAVHPPTLDTMGRRRSLAAGRSSPSLPMPLSPQQSPRLSSPRLSMASGMSSDTTISPGQTRRQDSNMPGHSRRMSYSGPVPSSYPERESRERQGRGGRDGDRGNRRDNVSRSRSRPPRPDVSRTPVVVSRRDSDSQRQHRRHYSLSDAQRSNQSDYYRSSDQSRGSRKRSPSRPRLPSSQSASQIPSSPGGGGGSGSDSRRSRYPPPPSRNSTAVSSGSGQANTSSARRAPSPKSLNSFRMSLPDNIHRGGERDRDRDRDSEREKQYYTTPSSSNKDDYNIATIGRRSSYAGPPGRVSTDVLTSVLPTRSFTPPSMATANSLSLLSSSSPTSKAGRFPRDNSDRDTERGRDRDRDQDRDRYIMERRGRAEKDYRIYGSSQPTAPLSPLVPLMARRGSSIAGEMPKPLTTATSAARDIPSNSAHVISDNDDDDSRANDSDETWDDFRKTQSRTGA